MRIQIVMSLSCRTSRECCLLFTTTQMQRKSRMTSIHCTAAILSLTWASWIVFPLSQSLWTRKLASDLRRTNKRSIRTLRIKLLSLILFKRVQLLMDDSVSYTDRSIKRIFKIKSFFFIYRCKYCEKWTLSIWKTFFYRLLTHWKTRIQF